MRISVAIISYNAREHLQGCLAKLAPELAPGDEILVVDNGSTDGSPEMVRRAHPGVRLLELGENLGFGAANNRAADLAQGDALLLLNSDAWLLPGALDVLRRALDADPRLGAVAPDLRYPDGRRQFAWGAETSVVGEAIQKLRNPFEGRWWNHVLLPAVLRPLLGPGWWTAACLLVRKAAFDAVDGFDEGFFLYFEDCDLSLRLRRAGWRLGAARGARAVHLKGGSETGITSRLAYRHGQLRYYAKHRPAWENRLLHRRLRRRLGQGGLSTANGSDGGAPDAKQRERWLALLEDPLAPFVP